MERTQACSLPLGLVAKRRGDFVGAIAIAANAILVRPELSSCLVGLLVAPANHKCGIGTALLRAAIVKVGELGFERVYSSMAIVPDIFTRSGWTEIKKKFLVGAELLI